MRRALIGAVVAITLMVTGLLLGPTVWAQTRGREVTPGIDRLLQRGAGSEIGVSVRELRAEEIASAKLDPPGGVVIDDVREGTPAARAGFRAGDIVVSFDGERVRGARHFSRLVLETPSGRTVNSVVLRGSDRQNIAVTPDPARGLRTMIPDISREIERGMRAIPRDFDFDIPARSPRARLGIGLSPLSDQLASYFGAKNGVLVSRVEPDSPAAQAGLRAGDVITAVAGRTVNDAADVTEGIRAAAPGSAVELRIVRDRKEMTVTTTVPDQRRDTRNRDRIPV